MQANLCVIIFTYNRPDDLKRCLDSVMMQTLQRFELLVVNNDDDRRSEAVLKEYPARIINDRTRRLSYLFNLGWKNTDKEFIAYLADDAELSPHWLEEGLTSFECHLQAAVVTGPLVSPFEFSGEMHALWTRAKTNPVLLFFARFYDKFILEGKTFEPAMLCESGSYTLGQGFKPDFSEDREVDLATSSSMLIKRSAIKSVGGFDENFYFNHADGDLFIRLKKNGYKIIYNPRMQAIHYIRLGPSRNPFFIGRDTAYFYLKDIRPKRIMGVFMAITNIFILNIYWIYKTFQVKDIKQLRGILGFIKGIIDYVKK